MEEDGLGRDKKYFGGDNIGIVDIAFGQNIAQWLGVNEEVVGMKLLEAHKFPRNCMHGSRVLRKCL
jgi:glutathione S-transferase